MEKTKVQIVKMTVTPVKLSAVVLAYKKLRFCMIDRDNVFYNTTDIEMSGCQPLFLGSDVLSGASEWSKNSSRIHARFAKQGLATKLLFTGCRIADLKKGDEAYFYNVHGLFRAVFEYHSYEVQRQCLLRLSDVWKRACLAESQPQLDVAYEVTMHNLVLTHSTQAPRPADEVHSVLAHKTQSQTPEDGHEEQLQASTPRDEIHSVLAHKTQSQTPEDGHEDQLQASTPRDEVHKTQSQASKDGHGVHSLVLTHKTQSQTPAPANEVQSVVLTHNAQSQTHPEDGDEVHSVFLTHNTQTPRHRDEAVSGQGNGDASRAAPVRSGLQTSSNDLFRYSIPEAQVGEFADCIRRRAHSSVLPVSFREQDTQTDDAETERPGGLQQQGVSDFVCKMCRIKIQMTEREKDELKLMRVEAQTDRHRRNITEGLRGGDGQVRQMCNSLDETYGAGTETDAHRGGIVQRTLQSGNLESDVRQSETVIHVTVVNSLQSNETDGESLLGKYMLRERLSALSHHVDEPCLSTMNNNEDGAGVSTQMSGCVSHMTVEDNLRSLSNSGEDMQYQSPVQNCTQQGNLVQNDHHENVTHLHLHSLPAEEMDVGDYAADPHSVMVPSMSSIACPPESMAVSTDGVSSSSDGHCAWPAEGTEQGLPGAVLHKDAAACVQGWSEEANTLKGVLCAGDTRGEAPCGHSRHTRETSPPQYIQLEYVLVVLDFLARTMDRVKTPADLSTVSDLLALTHLSTENSADFASNPQGWPAVSTLKLSALTTFGKWLGEECRRFEPAIAQRVLDFKRTYIDNISDLPPAAQVVEELFPPFMVHCTSAWIGLTDMQVAEAAERDHSYERQGAEEGEGVGGSSRPGQNNRNLYPVLQLVLELLNNSLVSGIAHVVYCKLRHAS